MKIVLYVYPRHDYTNLTKILILKYPTILCTVETNGQVTYIHNSVNSNRLTCFEPAVSEIICLEIKCTAKYPCALALGLQSILKMFLLLLLPRCIID